MKKLHAEAGGESTIFLVAIKGLSEWSKTKIYDGNVILFCPRLAENRP